MTSRPSTTRPSNLRVARPLASVLPPSPTPRASDVAVTVEGVFSLDECEGLIECFEAASSLVSTLPGRRLGPVGPADAAYKARRDVTISDLELIEVIGDRLAAAVLPVVASRLGVIVRSFEVFKLVRYDAGAGWFRPHRDNATPACAHRRAALTVNLDTLRYEGGRLRFAELGGLEVDPPTGAALVFAAGLVHEVLPVTAGQRYALVSFFS